MSAINTLLSVTSVDLETLRPEPTVEGFSEPGGYSCIAIRPIALRMVYEVARAVTIPVIGLGGIVTPEDVVEFMLAGASAVQVGTASYADPRAVERISRGLESWCRSHQVERVASLIGALDMPRG